MTFVKHGDEMPIVEEYDDEGKIIYCDKCGKPKQSIYTDSNKNTPACECENEEHTNE